MELSKPALLLAVIGSNAAASLALKWASLQRETGAPSLNVLDIQRKEFLITAAALALYAMSFVAYMLALRQWPVSIAYPVVTGLTSLVLAIAAGLLFGETLTLKSMAGICFVLLGAFLLLKA